MSDLIQLLAEYAVFIALVLSMATLGYKLGYRNGWRAGLQRNQSFTRLKAIERLKSHGRN